MGYTKVAIRKSKHLGMIIQSARKAQKLSQDDLAGLTGTGRRFISELESGKETAQLAKTLHVLQCLGISLIAEYTWNE
ncbi:MAG: transcriptional regulator [Alphaproteobacteria bacterium]|nr:MAG: transcriptional regulator [Alphaproteobacteria bacterium]TAF13741.1 MAG: transcriptional regulator [Alphaproteobacteria bacterium]TAF42016.1 MAG: transcriptional regulator [Alphaproteobacteria bacterium]TAF76651.1 MAG: transcriptional regulator [Alphaproteobacteria bacterium]